MEKHCCLLYHYELEELYGIGTCESDVCIQIEYRIESGVTIRIRIESAIVI